MKKENYVKEKHQSNLTTSTKSNKENYEIAQNTTPTENKDQTEVDIEGQIDILAAVIIEIILKDIN